MVNILLLEDDEILSQSLKYLLNNEGFSITCVKNGEDALILTYDNSFDLYLLDVNVPLLSGFDFLQQMRESGDMTPAFFITALVDIQSISKGFDVGADDYIKKPFEPDELLIRINALLKKTISKLKYDHLSYDMQNGILYKDEKVVDLAYIEHQVFDLLIKNIGKIVTKEQFFEVMDKPSDAGLRVHINRLKKLLDLKVTNIRGVGYRLETV